MAAAATPNPEFVSVADVPGVRVSKTIRTPKGHQFTAVISGNIMTLTNVSGGGSIIVTGGGVEAFSVSGALNSILDGIGDALAGLKKLLSCTPVQTTHVDIKDGKVVGITVTNSCVPN